MPMYEYQCEACGLVFEARQKFSDAPLTECRACQGQVKKLISQNGFALKGGGWFDQGYGAQGAAPCAAAEAGGGCAGCPKAVNE
ncbi:MAG: zinc ribbon domain-containing protein [Desulfuromonadales bacterium]|nr:zinc ribbon domain-containing protein [Desulfuromonadales bacterium]MDT8424094.1 zinc ribbon domain-containing protein [Desulfuromonadales bacterium]